MSSVDFDLLYTECVAAEIQLRRALSLGSPAAYRAHGKRMAQPNPTLANASGCTQPGRENFGSDADYTAARNAR
jgi:hypothetical protein